MYKYMKWSWGGEGHQGGAFDLQHASDLYANGEG